MLKNIAEIIKFYKYFLIAYTSVKIVIIKIKFLRIIYILEYTFKFRYSKLKFLT